MKEPRKTPFVPVKPAREVESELQFHLEKRIAANVAAGMTPADARTAALERFGNVDGVREECTQLLTEERKTQARRDWFEDLGQDLRIAMRSAARAPMFTILAIITLALGIGANAAVFGVAKSVLLNSLPYEDAGRLVRVTTPLRTLGGTAGALSAGTVSDFRERQRSFSTSGIWLPARDVVYGDGDVPRVMKASYVEPALFTTLGVPFARGANVRDDEVRDTAFVTVLSHAAWQDLFGGAPDVVGRSVRINGMARTVVGVLARDFVPPEGEADFYLPFRVAPFMRDPISVRGSHSFGMVARLKDGVDHDAAAGELNAIGLELEKLYSKDNLGIDLKGTPLRDFMVGETRTPLIVLLASAALVLLITCANLAGALLSRTISRRKEFAVRIALGAGRERLVRQLLTESIALAIAGGVAGLALATGLLALLRGMSLDAIPRYADLSLDTGAMLVTFALTLLTGIAFGLGPALSVGRTDPQVSLRDETRGATESKRSGQMRGVLVAGQIALCVSLLAAGGLLTRSLWEMVSAPLGFNPDKLLAFSVQFQSTRHGPVPGRLAFYEEFTTRLRGIPGVTGVGITRDLPTMVGNSNGVFIEEKPWGANEAVPFIATSRVSDDFFRTFEIPLKEGRVFSPVDALDAPPVVVITQAMASRFWPKGNAVGSRIRWGPPDPDQPWTTVVGIVGDVRNSPAALKAEPMMFFPVRQQPAGETFILKTTGNPTALVPAARAALAEIDRALPMYKITTMDDVVAKGFAARRLPVVLMMGFGGLALLLASIGIYALFSSLGNAREREFGVRIALGSSRADVAKLVLGQGGKWMALGLVLGAVGVYAASRLVRTQLYGVPEFDPISIGAAVLLLLVCAGIALLVPVRRATRVDPISVLR
jgi:putative ABC transport system permease protein